MYTRYKPRKKEKKFVKYIFLILAVSGLFYLGYVHRSTLMFWKYNISRLDRELLEIDKAADRQSRIRMLQNLEKACDSYKNDNPFSSEAYFSSGRVKVLLGEALMPASFNELFITDRLTEQSEGVRKCFIEAVKDIKKAAALENGRIDDRNLMLLAKASFFAGYYTPVEIAEMLSAVKNLDLLLPEDRRLYATIQVLGGSEARGIDVLKNTGGNDAMDTLFLATVYRITNKHTEAILEYKKALEKAADDEIKTLIHFNLGKIYLAQSLMMEAAKEFNDAVSIAPGKADLRVWAGKSCAALGDKAKAREHWLEALKLEPDNAEVKKLLEGR